ncbi:MAG: helix-turn-helix transcriptional regulator [Bdellovibrio sp.]
MNQKERVVIAFVLAVIAVMVGFDLFTDSKEGVAIWHLLVEASIAAVALLGVFYILRGSVELKHRLEREITDFNHFKKEAELWKVESRKYLDGLSKAIDQQLSKWKLTVAEKEVAFLLLKGMSLKEIAEIRNTAEKTARVQSLAIYSKSGLSGRSELSAFFLEDLLVPPDIENSSKSFPIEDVEQATTTKGDEN